MMAQPSTEARRLRFGTRKGLEAVGIALACFLGQRCCADVILQSVDWTAQGVAPVSALGGAWSFGTVSGTTAAVRNGGAVYAVTWEDLAFCTDYNTTVAEGVTLAAPNSSIQVQTLSFSSTLSSVYLFVNWTEDGTEFDFGTYNWTLVDANHAYRDGSRVVVSGATDDIGDGFLVNITNTFGPGQNLTFSFINSTNLGWADGQSVGFTLGQGAPVPEPGTGITALLLVVSAACARRRRPTTRT